jgi:hypothetical protein
VVELSNVLLPFSSDFGITGVTSEATSIKLRNLQFLALFLLS